MKKWETFEMRMQAQQIQGQLRNTSGYILKQIGNLKVRCKNRNQKNLIYGLSSKQEATQKEAIRIKK